MPSGVYKRKVIPTIDIVCPICNKIKEVKITCKRFPKYCSPKCYHKSLRKNKEDAFCKMCGKQLNKRQTKYCSEDCFHSDPDVGKSISETMTQLYIDRPELREICGSSMKGKHHSEKSKKQNSDTHKQTFIDHPELKEEKRQQQLKRYEDPNEHIRTSESTKKAFTDDPSIRIRQSNSIKIRWQDPIFVENQIETHKDTFFFDTSIELKVREELTKLEIIYETHFPLIGLPDIYIPEYNLIIMCDGDYFHANPLKYKEDFVMKGKIAKDIWDYDRYITSQLESQGFTVLRFWESEINNNFDEVRNRILETINCIKVLA